MDCPSGMKTTLYHYQKASLWKILQRELAPMFIHGPTVVKLLSVDGTTYYHDQLTGISTLEPLLQKDIQGGIICEDMGTGKTCICLAAVMSTKSILPPLDDVIFKTDFLDNYQKNLKAAAPEPFTSLRSLAGVEIMKYNVDWRPYQKLLPSEMTSAFEQSPPYYEWIPVQYQSTMDRPHRRQIKVTTLKIYLSAATLVVVPDNLVAQWSGEIYKHIHDGHLEFIVLENKNQPIPEPLELVQLDMVLMSQSRFSHEYAAGGFAFQGIPRKCKCPYIGRTREKNCICGSKPIYTSPLLQVHWKRVIVDEGHSLSSRNSRASELSSKLLCVWNWICTGTPTQNLTEAASVRTRQEGISDDLTRLGTLLGDILKLEPFASRRKLWSQLVRKPVELGKVWALATVNELMCRTMIRNQRRTIENDVILPPLSYKTVELDFDYYQWLAHNCQISMISLNAILSEREGVDYLFNKKNQQALRETVSNLRQSCTWHSIDLAALRSAHSNCDEKLKKVDAGTTHMDADDEVDLRRLKQVFGLALDDPVFMDMMTKHEVSFVVQGLPNLMKETWGWCSGTRGAYLPVSTDPWDDHCLVSGDIVVDLMNDVTNVNKANKDIYVYNSNTKSLESTEVYSKRKRAAMKGKDDKGGGKKRKNRHDDTNNASESSTPNGAASKTNDEPQSEPLTFYTRNVFTDVRVLCSTSSKINYLVDQILLHSAKEKCIIFSQYYNEMQEIYLALQLVKVRTLMYLDTSMASIKRSQTIMTFNTSENANVMIMAVQKAAYGIDLSSASRVYFCSPVWQTAMEQQAIKRAHRIGQTKPVFVETLVIRHSIEDALLKRRRVVSDNPGVDFYADKRLQNILNHANIVPKPDHIHQSNDDGSYYQPISFLKKPIWISPHSPTTPTTPKSTLDLISTSTVDSEPTLDITAINPSSQKKRKVVSFIES
ncbi:unnamed protein product [Absidia cylindrospora]